MPRSLSTVAWRGTFIFGAVLAGNACRSEPLPTRGAESNAGGALSAVGGSPSAAGESNEAAGAPMTEATTIVALDRATVTSDPQAENFQRVSAHVDFGRAEVASATLRVSLLSPCFPFEGWAEQGVPDGQNWPERCDAFDRTLSVSLDEAQTPERGQPGLELLRAITPFGGPLELRADITDIVNGMPGEHELQLRIDTWSDSEGQVSGSKGEWIASAAIDFVAGAAPRRVLAVVPLVLENQTAIDAEPTPFEVPEGVGSARIEYRVTGHGGEPDISCRGPAEEFCRRTHELRLDDALISELVPWRTDCDTLCTLTTNDVLGPTSYCAENPCGAPESVRAPRANWCPGSMTPPLVIEHPRLSEPGAHTLDRRIIALRVGGGWRVSATYFAFE